MNLDEFKSLIKSYSAKKIDYECAKANLSRLSEDMHDIEVQIEAAMEALQLSKFSMDEIGTVYIQQNMSVKTPKLPEDKEAFYAYLKSIGEFDSMISVNSQTLNSWYKAKLEAGVDPNIPGLREVSEYKKVILRKG